MDSFSHIIMSSLSEIWHLVPIVIAIILFKKYINVRDRKNRIIKNEENEKNGLTLKVRTIKKYEDLGYKVEDIQDSEGIDLVCTKDDKTFIMHLNNYAEKKIVIDDDIEEFYDNAIAYTKANNLDTNNLAFRYIIPYIDVLDKSAIKIFADDYYKCKYVIL